MKKDDIYVDFGKRLAKLRAEKEISQAEAAKELKMAQSTYAGYESAVRKVRMEIIVSLSNYYGVSPDYLINGNTKNINQYQILKSDEKQLLDNYRELNEIGQKRLLDDSKMYISNNELIKRGHINAKFDESAGTAS